jgi:cytochrome P450
MTETANELLADWASAPQGETRALDRDMTRVTLKIVGRALFSVDLTGDMRALGEGFARANDDLSFRIQHPFYPPYWVPTARNRHANAARRANADIILRLIHERMASGENKNDLLSLLMSMREAETGKGLTENELYRETLVMLFAGHDTTANALTWAWYFLSQHPEAEQKLHAEVDARLQGRAPVMDDVPQLLYTRRVLDETMRLAPPAWITSRASIHADMLGEYKLPPRAPVLISPYTMHRHPRYWKNPDAFDPDRFAPENSDKLPRFVYMPFGGGPRLCIGQPFALAEATLLLAAIAQRYTLRLAPNANIVPAPRITLGMANGLPMTLHARS